ncbi:hypothetical protein V9T40_007394 [Parthenolecanium corni]|uniref:Spaetzle domain-containing protein n=1 Tax=Parthenolecanium corni TaxID=536013 RepID=A0AAN9TYB4_9HEMI
MLGSGNENHFRCVNSFIFGFRCVGITELCATPQQESLSVESVRHTPLAISDSDASSKVAKHFQTDDIAQSMLHSAKMKQNSNGASAVGKPVALAAAASVSNFENRGASDSYKKILNRKSQAVNSEKNDSVIFPPAVSGVNTRTSFSSIEENLIPTSDEIAQCQSNSVAGTSLCNITSKYPSSFVRNILNKRDLSSLVFGNDLLSPEIKTDTIGTRFQGDQGFKTLCASREFLHYPRLGKTASSEWRYIIQSDDNSQRFVQGIRVEVCVKENQKCDLVDNFPIGYEVQCVQKYIYRRLLAISPGDKAAIPDNFEFPSCCVCVYKSSSESDLRSRFAHDRTSAASKPAPTKPSPSRPSAPRSPPKRAFAPPPPPGYGPGITTSSRRLQWHEPDYVSNVRTSKSNEWKPAKDSEH